jgi:uncharacterized protein (TIGR02300 family)
MNKNPVISPYTGQVVPIVVPMRGRAEPVAARPAEVEEEVELDVAADAELISLEEADDEAGGSKAAVADDDIEVEDDAAGDDDTFLEEDEDASDDVTDLIGDGIEDDEEP